MIVVSGRVRIDNLKENPNAKKVEQYYGTDASRFEGYSPVHHINRDSVATFVAWAEFENPLITSTAPSWCFAWRRPSEVASHDVVARPQSFLSDRAYRHFGRPAWEGDRELPTKSTVSERIMDTAIEAKLTFLCAVAVHAEIEELLPQFRRQHGIEVDVNYDVNPAVAKRVMAGEDFDVGLNNPWYVEEMIKHGLVIPDIHVPFGRVPLTIGAAGPEPEEIASSQEAVRKLC